MIKKFNKKNHSVRMALIFNGLTKIKKCNYLLFFDLHNN